MIESHNEPDDWDDSVILKVFHDSLRKHTTREKRVQDEIDIDNHKSSDMGSKQRLNNPAALGKRKLDDVVDNDSSKYPNSNRQKPVGFQAALNNFLALKKKSPKSIENNISAGNSLDAEVKYDIIEHAPSITTNDVTNDVPKELLKRGFQSSNPVPDQGPTSCDDNPSEIPHPIQSVFSVPTTISSAMVDDAMQAMLMAWYQSGYATGRYQTLCELSGYNGYSMNAAPQPTQRDT